MGCHKTTAGELLAARLRLLDLRVHLGDAARAKASADQILRSFGSPGWQLHVLYGAVRLGPRI